PLTFHLSLPFPCRAVTNALHRRRHRLKKQRAALPLHLLLPYVALSLCSLQPTPLLHLLLLYITPPTLNATTAPSSPMRRAAPVLLASNAATARLLLPSVMSHHRRGRGLVSPLFQRCTSALTSTLLRRVFVTSITCHFAPFTQMI
ncbi:hypothetical protein HN51_055684, partial [Arachis hypogaea]